MAENAEPAPGKDTAEDVARWMAEKYAENRLLYQSVAVNGIAERFGETFLYRNKEGGRSISKAVLRHLKKLTPTAVWERAEKMWRERRRSDKGRLGD